MSGRAVDLISNKSGKRYSFKSMREADHFLDRKKHYVGIMSSRGYDVTHRLTKEEFRVEFSQPERKYTRRKYTSVQLCWDCKKSINGCSWSRKGQPVEGWTAEPTIVNFTTPSYRILECPEFEQE